jgi:hypothetical protein
MFPVALILPEGTCSPQLHMHLAPPTDITSELNLTSTLLQVGYTASMSIIGILVFLIVVGVLLWAVNSIVPMDARMKNIFNVVVVVAVVFYLIRAFGLNGHLPW